LSKIEVENPKEVYRDIKSLIYEHYQKEGSADDPFTRKYPHLYRLYLRIASYGLHK